MVEKFGHCWFEPKFNKSTQSFETNEWENVILEFRVLLKFTV